MRGGKRGCGRGAGAGGLLSEQFARHVVSDSSTPTISDVGR